ncbi:uncharacterized protein LOC143187231 [Calliopsis andreniformis]|uniref:uncharacterized protein LOC143187231 n=1 Tax=Calliopsis andreniformis TaxID=337506 RepID=UPI003FCE4365
MALAFSSRPIRVQMLALRGMKLNVRLYVVALTRARSLSVWYDAQAKITFCSKLLVFDECQSRFRSSTVPFLALLSSFLFFIFYVPILVHISAGSQMVGLEQSSVNPIPKVNLFLSASLLS